MNHQSDGGTRHRPVLLAGFATLIPLAAFAAFAVLTALAGFRAVEESRLHDTTRALAGAVDAELGAAIAALRTLASSDHLDGELDAARFAERSRAVGELFGGWVVLLGPAPEKRVLMLSKAPDQAALPAQLPPGSRRAVDALLTRVYGLGWAGVSDLFEGSVIRRPIVTVMVPVDRDGQPRRALALSFEPATLRALLARQSLPPGTFAAIADGQLRVLAHSFDPAGERLGASAPGWVAAAIEGRQSAILVGPGWQGRDNIYAVERLAWAPGWTVTVAAPAEAQRKAAWTAIGWALGGAGALGLGLAIILWAARREEIAVAEREASALRAGRAEIERLHGGLPVTVFLSRVTAEGPETRIERLYMAGDTQAVLGWPPAALAALPPGTRLGAPDEVPLAERFRKVLETGEHAWEWRVRRQDGGCSWIRARARRLGGPGPSAEVVGYNLNIDREKEAEARAIAAARLASLGEMAAGLAHEMKQPLQAISLAAELAELALRRGTAADVEARLAAIVQQTRRTAELIDRLRRFARGAEEGVEVAEVPLGVAVQGALDLASGVLRDAGVTVETGLGDPPPVVQGQALLLEQVLSNLLLNACDAMAARPEGAPRRIRIAADPGPDGTVRLSVADTGGGIAPEVMARLFEPFVTTKGPQAGTGLGLSICHGLVRSMGGSIEARNDTEGAVFTVTLRAAA